MQYAQTFSNGNPICSNPPYTRAVIPEIIGEGDVTSLIFPDGTKQYFFQPRNFILNPSIFKSNYVWIIKSISEPQYIQTISYFTPSIMPSTFPQAEPMEQCYDPPTYPLKFHNDALSSTSDLHYFFPNLRQRAWIPNVDASVQSRIPTEPFNNDCRCNINKVNDVTIKDSSSTTMFVNVKDSLDVYKKKIKLSCNQKTSTTSVESKFISFLKKRKHADFVNCKCQNSKVICNCGNKNINNVKRVCSDDENKSKDQRKNNVTFQTDGEKVTQTAGCACVVKYNI